MQRNVYGKLWLEVWNVPPTSVSAHLSVITAIHYSVKYGSWWHLCLNVIEWITQGNLGMNNKKKNKKNPKWGKIWERQCGKSLHHYLFLGMLPLSFLIFARLLKNTLMPDSNMFNRPAMRANKRTGASIHSHTSAHLIHKVIIVKELRINLPCFCLNKNHTLC